MKKHHVFLLLDDAKEDRYFAVRTLKRVFPDCKIHEFWYAEDALAFLKTPDRDSIDTILIDLNMPRMTGLEFAEHYQELYPELKGEASIYMLSSSINPRDQAEALAHPAITGYFEKPLTRDILAELT